MYKNSVVNCKNLLRKKYKAIRKSIAEDKRNEYNKEIMNRIINSEYYKNTDTVFAYVSIGDEVNTYSIIKYTLKEGKKVAVPYCIPNTPLMEFYYINSINDLKKGSFGVPEPDIKICIKATDKKGVILVPGLAFDKYGYRMGYGKGYYDRYLTDFNGVKIGLCYSACMSRCILHNCHDKSVDYIITDNFTKFIAK